LLLLELKAKLKYVIIQISTISSKNSINIF
jgi:hypothetical protein